MSYNKISKDNIDHLLFEVAKEYHKLGRKAKGEIIIVGGAAIVANYEFRNMSEDADAIIRAESHLKEAILNVARKNNLPDNWLNTDFTTTRSYSDKLILYSKFYKEFANSIQVRTIEREYLIAMKLVSFRKYKNDVSDIIGILTSEFNRNNEIKIGEIKNAIIALYGNYNYISLEARTFIEKALDNHSYLDKYQDVLNDEKIGRNIVANAHDKNINARSINYILIELKDRELSNLYKELGIELTNDMSLNAIHSQEKLIEKYKEEKLDISLEEYIRDYFKDLYLLHNQYLDK